MDRAAESVERDGIACTSELEHTLFDEMNGLCREVMSTLLSEGAAAHVHYEPGPAERHGGVHAKRIVTLFGETPAIRRAYYHDEDAKRGHFPFDDRLGLVGRYTPAAAAEIARQAVGSPYAEAAAEFSRAHGFAVSADTVRALVGRLGPSARAFAADKEAGGRDDADGRAPLVCVMADGTGVPFRRKSLGGTKGRDGRARTREVKAGAVFTASKTSANEPHRDLGTTTYVATLRGVDGFGRALRAEFDRRFGKCPGTVLYVTDGGKWLRTVHDAHFPFATEILDVYHALEHLAPLMRGLGFKEGTDEWKRQYRYWKGRVKAGKVESVLASVERRFKGRLGKDALRECGYFRDNAKRMRYDVYRANGWFIGSGVIESGCKTVIGQRFKRSGMNWSPRGVKALLSLRTLHKSNRLEDFFRHRIRDLEQVKCA